MSRYDIWLDQQRTLVDSGAAVEKIVLEGPDGSAWGTWTLRFPNLSESIDGILGQLREQMPKGKHPAKLVAFAGDGSQVSVMPLTIVGANDGASEASQNQLNLQKATALAVANLEKVTLSVAAALDAATVRESQMTERYSELLQSLNRVEDASREAFREDERRVAREARMDKMLESFAPLIAMGANFLGEYATAWLKEQKVEPKPLETGSSSAGVSSTDSVVDSKHEPPDSAEPAESHSNGAGASPRKHRADGEGCSAGNGGSVSRTVGRKTQKPNRKR